MVAFNSLCEIHRYMAGWIYLFSSLSILFVRFRPRGSGPLLRGRFSFQFSLWDSTILGWCDYFDNYKTFNSLCEIRYICDLHAEPLSQDFQFSLWDSGFSGTVRDVILAFNSLCEIQTGITMAKPGFDSAFNSLCEIQRYKAVFSVFDPILSILFVRFTVKTEPGTAGVMTTFNSLCEIPELGSEKACGKDNSLSILFVRFSQSHPSYNSTSTAFNSLCEIPDIIANLLNFLEMTVELSILFVRFEMRYVSPSNAYPWNFQFSLWDSW